MASHFRYGNLNWQPTANAGEVKFNFTGSFRRSSYGAPNVGDIFTEAQGATSFFYGDGASTGTLRFRVIALSATDDYVIGEALNPGTDNAGLLHTYVGAGPFMNAGISSCCRIGASLNRSGGNYQMFTTVSPLSGNSSPVSSQVPIVTVTQGPASTFVVQASDPNGDGLRYRFSTDAEAGGGAPPPGMTINPNSGLVTWNTVGLSTSGVWTVQVIIEDLDVSGNIKTSIPVDFQLKIDVSSGTPPTLVINPPGPFNVAPGAPIAFSVTGSDVDGGATVTLNTGGVPIGSTMAPGLPISGAGSPGVTSNFSWTPQAANSGSYVITYSVTDNTGSQVQDTVQINVSTLPAPSTTNSAPSGITQTGATLNGIVNPNGVATTYRFEYGLDATYGNSTAPVTAGSGTTDVPVSQTISGLSLNTLYHYRLVASSAGGNSVAPDATFTTGGIPNTPPTVSLTAPGNGDTITEITPLTVTATAADSDGTVTKVEFFEGANKLGEDTTSPYELNVGVLPVGTYIITAVATDDDGDSVTSGAATLNVVEATPIPVDDNAFVGLTYVKINARRNDAGPASLPLTIVAIGGTPTKGTVSIIENGARVRYDSTVAMVQGQSDTFTYTVRNSLGREATASVTVHPAPVKGSQFVSLLRDDHGEAFGIISYSFIRTGAFTGNVTYNGKRFGFKGNLTGDSPLTLNVKRGPTIVPLAIDLGAGVILDGSVSLASDMPDPFGLEEWSGNAVRSPFSTTNPPARAGYYTLGFNPDATHVGDIAYPQGGAGLSIRVTPTGAVRILGRSPDGIGTSCSSYLLTGEHVPFFMATGPGIRRGKWHGDMQFTSSGPELTATSEWAMPVRVGALLYPLGFTVSMDAVGCAYTRPALPSGILSGPNIRFDFADAGFLTPMSVLISFGSEAQIPGPAPLVATRVGRAYGTIGGQVRNADALGIQGFYGVVLQHPTLNRIQGSTYRKTGIGSFGGVVQ